MAERATVRYDQGKGQQSDPVSPSILAAEFAKGTISGKTRVWSQGMSNWTALEKCQAEPWFIHFQAIRAAKPAAVSLRYEVSKGKQSDPTSIGELAALLASSGSDVTDATRVWAVGMAGWTVVAECDAQPWFEKLSAEVLALQTSSPTKAAPSQPELAAPAPAPEPEPEPEPESAPEPAPEPESTQPLEAAEGSQIHVRGVAGKFETEDALKAIFVQFGPVIQATIRHRTDTDTGANTSWALVTMESRDAAEAVMASAGNLPRPVTVTRFSKQQAASSTGQMGAVRREAAAKMIQSQFRRQMGYRQALMMSMDFGGEWDEESTSTAAPPKQVSGSGAPAEQLESERAAHAATKRQAAMDAAESVAMGDTALAEMAVQLAAAEQQAKTLADELQAAEATSAATADEEATQLRATLREQEALTEQAMAQAKSTAERLEQLEAEIVSINAAFDGEKAAHTRTQQQLDLSLTAHTQAVSLHQKRSTSSDAEKKSANQNAEDARRTADAAAAASVEATKENAHIRTELQSKLSAALSVGESLRSEAEVAGRMSRAHIEKVESQTAAAVQQVASEAAHTAQVAGELRECRAELARIRSAASPAVALTDSDAAEQLAAARSGEAEAKEQARTLQKTLDASIELCKKAESSWEARHEAHCQEMAALRDNITAYIEGEEDEESQRGRSKSWWSKIGSGDNGKKGSVADTDLATRDADDDTDDGAEGEGEGEDVFEEGMPPVPEWVPGPASPPRSANLAHGSAGGASLTVSAASTVGMTLSPYSMTSSQPYSSAGNPSGVGGVGGVVMGGGAPPASPTPGTGRSVGKIYTM